jgi:hypothetical protein
MNIRRCDLNTNDIITYLRNTLVVALLLAATGCSQKFKTAAPYKNITIIYGLIDMRDTAHYVRVEKAFSDQDKSSFTMAQIPDSNFYSSISVRIERYDFSYNLRDTVHLNRVDLNLEGYPKQPGIFYTAPNYAYKFTTLLDPHSLYRLVVTNLATGVTNYADAPIIDNTNDSIFSTFPVDYPSPGIDFSSTVTIDPYKITGNYISRVPEYSFNGQSDPVSVAQAVIRFNWVDSNLLTHSVTDQHYDDYLPYIIPTLAYPGASFEYDIHNLELYTALYMGMGAAPPDICRLISRCDFAVYLSTSDFLLYQQSTFAQNTGLTGGYIQPIVTNIKGPDALGLFTSRAFQTAKVIIGYTTIDSIMHSPMFRNANVVGASNH